MLNKIKSLDKKQLTVTFGDVRTLGLLAFGIIGLLVTWSGIKVVQTNYDLQKQIAAMQQQNDVRKLENSNLKLRNQFLDTDTYLELAARKQYNKALPGEKLLIVPASVAMSYTIEPLPAQAASTNTPSAEESGPWYEKNFNAWLDFLFKQQG